VELDCFVLKSGLRAIPPTLFALLLLEIGSCFMPYFTLSTISEMTGEYHHTQLFSVQMEPVLELWSSQSQPHINGMTGVCHCIQLLVRQGLTNFLSWLDPPNLILPRRLHLQLWATCTWPNLSLLEKTNPVFILKICICYTQYFYRKDI
jgi:hypothetical protein